MANIHIVHELCTIVNNNHCNIILSLRKESDDARGVAYLIFFWGDNFFLLHTPVKSDYYILFRIWTRDAVPVTTATVISKHQVLCVEFVDKIDKLVSSI